MISVGGILNIAACIIGAQHLAPHYIPLLTLTGDLTLSAILAVYFIRHRKFSW